MFCYDVMTDLASREKLCFQDIYHQHHVCMYPIGLEVYCLYGTLSCIYTFWCLSRLSNATISEGDGIRAMYNVSKTKQCANLISSLVMLYKNCYNCGLN